MNPAFVSILAAANAAGRDLSDWLVSATRMLPFERDDWIAVDLDGTLAEHRDTWKGTEIGKPIAKMVKRVCRWIDEGKVVVVYTARVGPQGRYATTEKEHRLAIAKWCVENLGAILPITAVKDYRIAEFWDDRGVAVERNKGTPLVWPKLRKLKKWEL